MQAIKLLGKVLFASAILYWFFSSGKLDLNLLYKSLDRPATWSICFIILISNIFMMSYRWKYLLQMKSSKTFKFFTIVRLTWIGNMFNLVLPGAVSGDVVKLIYARNIDNNLSKTFLLTSVLMDRIFGLFGLIFLLGITSTVSYSYLINISESVKFLVHFNYIIFFSMVLFLSTLSMPASLQEKILSKSIHIPILGKKLSQIIKYLWIIGQSKKNIFKLISISVFGQIITIYSFWLIASPYFSYSSINADLTFLQLLTFVPLGLITIAIPITPAGLGVGHAAFQQLFSFYHIDNGASLFNFFFLSTVCTNILGIIPYLLSSMSKQETAQVALD